MTDAGAGMLKGRGDGSDPYRELFERSADAILIIDGEDFVDCNAAAVAMLRYKNKEQILRTHPSKLSPPVQPDGRDSFEKANAMIALAIEKGNNRFEWNHLRADGEVFPVEVLLTAVPHDGRTLVHVVWRELTERKQLEERLRLSETMEAVGRMAGGIAHDFNNLLVAIIGNSDILAATLTDSPDELACVDEIQKAANRAAALVRQLMAFSRKRDLQEKVVDLPATLRDMENILRRLLDERFQLELRVGPEPLHVLCGVGQLEQVVINLVANARDAMSDGGLVRIDLRPLMHSGASIGVGVDLPAGAYAVLSVSDAGHGMTPEVARRAFDPFFTTKGVGKGTGLGLATVYAIAQHCRGGAEIQSAVGLGTTVRVYLPLTSEHASSETPVEASVEAGGSETILVVEDETIVATLVVRVLRAAGYRVLLAADGLEALDVWVDRASPVHLVLTDVVMPRMGGVDLARRLRASGYRGAILLTSGYTSDALEQAKDLGGDVGLLEKPYVTADLLGRVREALARVDG